jgi:Tape measure protein
LSVLGDLIVKIGADITGFTSSMSTVMEKMDEAGESVTKNLASIEAVGQRLAVAGTIITAAVTLPILGLAKSALETAGAFEQTQVAFTHFMGSAREAKAYLADLYAFAATTPFQITDLTKGAQALMAMGTSAKDVIPMLRIIGDQLSAVGRPENLQRVIFAFGELSRATKGYGVQLRELLQDAAIPAKEYLAEAFNIPIGMIDAALKKGLIPGAAAAKAILAGMARDTGGLMKEQMDTFVGIMTNVRDQIILTLKAIGDTLLPYAKTFSVFANSALSGARQIAQAFADLPAPVQGFTLSLIGLIAAVGPLITLVGGFLMTVAPIAAIVGMTSASFIVWTVAIVAAVAALVGLGVWVAHNWEPIKAVVTQGWEGLQEMWGAVWNWAKGFLTGTWTVIATAAKVIFGGMAETIKWIFDGVVKLIGAAWQVTMVQFSLLMALAEKIPGVKKMLSVGDVWNDQKSILAFNDNLKKQRENYEALQGEMRVAGREAQKLTDAHLGTAEAATKHGKAVDETYFAYNRWDKKSLDWAMWLRAHTAELAKQNIAFAEFSKAVESGGMAEEAGALGDHMAKMGEMHKKTSDDLAKFFEEADAGHYVKDIADAYKKLGVESTASLKQQAAQTADAYKVIATSGHATADQLRASWIAMEEARVKATEAADGKISLADKLRLFTAKFQQQQAAAGGGVSGMAQLFSKNSFDAFGKSFDTAINGLLNGTMKFKAAWGTMIQGMLQSWTSSLAQMATDWISAQVLRLARWVLTDLGIISSTQTTKAAAAASGWAETIAGITMAAALAGANAYAATAIIPFVGPELAPAAAAASYAGALSFLAVSAEGGADLPNMNTMALLHPREMVLPAALGDVVRSAAAGGGGDRQAGGDRHFHVNYTGAPGETLTENKLVSMMQGAVRKGRFGAPSTA